MKPLRIQEPGGATRIVLRRGSDASRDISLLAVLQLLIQYTLFALLEIYYAGINGRLVLFAYAVTFSLDVALFLVDRTRRPRIVPTLVMCNAYLLFFSGSWSVMLLVILLAWASRTFIVGPTRRHLLNAGTFGIFWGGLISAYGVGGSLMSVSHGLTTVPHLSALLILVGTGMAWLGGYLALTLSMLLSFVLLRGDPTAAEILVLLIAAPDPATTPARLWPRWVFGLMTGAFSAFWWAVFPNGNELLKVSGLVSAGLLMIPLRRLPWEGWAQRFGGKRGMEGYWAGSSVRLAGVALLAIYAMGRDITHPAKTMETTVLLTDAHSGKTMDERLDLPQWPSRTFSMTVGTQVCVVRWEEMFHGWDTRCDGEDWPMRAQATPPTLALSGVCGGRPLDGSRFLKYTGMTETSIHRGLRNFHVHVALDQEGLRNACTTTSGPAAPR